MTQVLHTADVHLTPEDRVRMEALECVLDLAESRDVDVVTIGGDLFDRPKDVDTLRTRLRNDHFSDRPFEILLIPGNHDVEAFRGDVFFGEACTVLTEEPFEHWTTRDGSLRITGVPYREQPDNEFLLALQDREPFDGPEALLFHGSLDAPFDDYTTGDDETYRYFPVTETLLSELDFEYFLAGHYHSPHKVRFENGSELTYPGSPASTSTAETGRRQVSLLDPEDGIEFTSIDTYHYVSQTFTATPGGERELFESVRAWVGHNVTEHAEAAVTVDGFTDLGEEEFHRFLAAAATPARVRNETRNVDHILSHPLYRSFENELQRVDWDDELTDQVTSRTLSVLSQLSAQGEI